jgi:hypothetical protein
VIYFLAVVFLGLECSGDLIRGAKVYTYEEVKEDEFTTTGIYERKTLPAKAAPDAASD